MRTRARRPDWLVDRGREGGAAGGEVVAEGPPEHVAAVPGSWTGHYLRRALETRERVVA